MADAPRLLAALAHRYRIERELGQGGMATVHLAHDLKHDRPVAIKVLRPELAAVLGAERFVQEIRTTAALQHPHILPLFDSGEADGFLYYVMPYVEGETLRTRLDREHQLGVDDAVRITVEVADALDYAHRHGVVHRDIKPENILLHDGRPMVADFGIALAVSAAAGGRMTETGLSLGTPHYMSPEQATAEKEITGRSDIYSLASVLYEMLTGNPPHTGASAQQIIMKIIAEPVTAVTTLRKNVPPNVAAALEQALEKLPADRFDSAKAFAAALGDHEFRTRSSASVEGPRRDRDRRLLGMAAVTLLAAGAAVYGWMRTGVPAPPLATAITTPFGSDPSDLPGIVAIAPHGNAIVYVDTAGGIQQLWIKERGVVSARPIPGTVGASGPTISPDGTELAYLASGRVMRLPLAGGAATVVSDSIPISFFLPGAWLDDGTLIFTSSVEVYVVPPGGGPTRRIATQDSLGRGIFQLSAVPRTRAALMTACGIFGCNNPQVFLVRIDPPEIRPLIQGAAAAWALDDGRVVYVLANGTMYVAPFDPDRATLGTPSELSGTVSIGHTGAALRMSPDGVMLYVTGGGPSPTSQVELVAAGRGHPPLLLTDSAGIEMAPYSGLDISPDGRSLLLSLSENGIGAYVVVRSLATGATVRFTSDGANNIRAKWSPDGRRILWLSDRRHGHFEVWWQAADGTGQPELLATEARDIYDALFSPDGRWLIYRTDNGAHGFGDIYARRLTGDTSVVPIATTRAEETSPDVSPDGHWITYAEVIGHMMQVVVRPFPDVHGGRLQVSAGGGSEPRWTPDGRTVIYRAPGGRFVFANVATRGALRVTGETSFGGFDADYLSATDQHQWALMPNGRDLLLARLKHTSGAGATPWRLILEEHTLPPAGRVR